MNERSYSYANCDLCGKDDTELLYMKDDFRIVKCKNCGMVYVNPRLREEELSKLYNRNVISPYDYYIETSDDDKRTFEKRLNLIEKYTKRGRLLDVGCATGTFSSVAKKRGWEVCGIDINEKSAKYCKEILGIDVQIGSFEAVETPKDFFDLVVMSDLLEHISSPTSALEKANGTMKVGGIIFIVTPKIDSVMARVSRKRWLHLKPNEHLYYFSSKTIFKMLEKTGFKIISITPIGRYRNLNTIFYKAQTYGDFVYKFVRIFVNNRIGRRISINLNLRDEMAVIGRKA